MISTDVSQGLDTVPYLSGGQWKISGGTRYGEVFNPSTGKAIATGGICAGGGGECGD